MMAYGAARHLANERARDGWEVLLSTPLAVEEILNGQRRALVQQFWRLVVLLALLDATVLATGLWMAQARPIALVFFVLLWGLYGLLWCGIHLRTISVAMWIGLWTGRAAYAAEKALFGSSLLGLIAYFIVRPILTGFPLGSLGELGVGVALFCMAAISAAHAGNVRSKLHAEFRQIAAAPIPKRDDPLFKGWDPNKIVP
jgi:hypothetical protein